MFKRILIPLDESPLAEKALTYLPRFIDPGHPPGQTEVVLLCVVEIMRYAAMTSEYQYAPFLIDDITKSYETYLQTMAQWLHDHGYGGITKLVEGDAAEQILAVAQETNADLIAMTTHGRSGVTRLALGSVAERVIQHAILPVLLVREETTMPHGKIERILVPLDGSAFAKQALCQAQTLAKATGATLHLLTVVAPIAYPYGLAYTPSSTAFAPGDDTIFNNTETALKAVGGAVQAAGVTCKTTVLRGDPASVICDVVNENQIDVVVISTHGRTGFKRWVYGSVANQVLHGVNCPVLVLRGVPSEAGE